MKAILKWKPHGKRPLDMRKQSDKIFGEIGIQDEETVA